MSIELDDKVVDLPASFPSVIDDRYKVEKILGKGGMAIVYQAEDTKTGETLALKQLLRKSDNAKQKRIAEHFEYEFYTLSQLAHPGVTKVFNYGKHNALPYYTMELLEGGDLRELSPFHWKQACTLLIEVCSALGLLHSRRQLHRDITPRNIYCTRNMKAKLIDFGAMMPMGSCKLLMGTPAYTSPEVVSLQVLDDRSDLYSLGTTLYYIVTGQNAYPARSFDELRMRWQSKPVSPSDIVPDIPKELEMLILSLIHLDPMARPVSAAEVMEKLGAIAGIEINEELLVSQAYLSTPTLVGRDRALARVRETLSLALGGQGATSIIEADAGAGRSRFLDACVLEGELLGFTILKADASDAGAGDWMVARSLALQLINLLPVLASQTARPHILVLSQIVPELDRIELGVDARPLKRSPAEEAGVRFNGEISSLKSLVEVWGGGFSSRPPSAQARNSIRVQISMSPQKLRSEIHEALCNWILRICNERPLMVVVDDLQRIDEPSAAFVALLSQVISDKKFLIAATLETAAPVTSTSAIKLLRKASSLAVKLGNLDLPETEKLISSMFGSTANVRLIADRLQGISAGNPRTIMSFTQHMLDKGLIRYQAGRWTLPSRIDTGDLPSSLNEALKARVRKLSADSLKLAQTMALSPDRGYCYEECQVLFDKREIPLLMRNLEELVTRGILVTDGEYYSFSQRGWVSALLEGMDQATEQMCHLKLAEMFEAQVRDQFRAARHLFRAKREKRALDTMVRFSESSKALTTRDPGAYPELLQSLPEDWYDTLNAAVDLAKKSGRPQRHVYIMQSRVSGLLAIRSSFDTKHMIQVIERLYRESGLAYFQEFDDCLPAQEKLGRALKTAQQIYDSSPESERVLAPIDAVRALAATIIEAVGVIYITDHIAIWQSIPSIKPLVPLSPAVGVVERSREALGHCVAGRIQQFHRCFSEVLERIDQPDKAALEGAHHQYLRYGVVHAIAVMEAMMGLKSGLSRVPEIESSPLLQVNAWKIRKIHHLWQAEFEEAEKCQQEVELLQIRNSPTEYYKGTHLSPELRTYCLANDLSGIRQILDDLENIAKAFPNWIPTLHYARGEHHRIRGDYTRALEELEAGLTGAAPGQHQNWAFIANGYLRTLLALGRDREAADKGQEFIRAAEREDLGYVCNYLIMPLALAYVNLEDYEKAIANAETAIEVFRSLGTTGLNLGLAYETRARVAISQDDEESFTTYAELCAEQYKVGKNPVLTAKYQKFMRQARAAKAGFLRNRVMEDDFSYISSIKDPSEIKQILEACVDSEKRAKCALEMLLNRSNCREGFLYTLQREGAVLTAKKGRNDPTAEIESLVKSRIRDEIERIEDATIAVADIEKGCGDTDWTCQEGSKYHALLLIHPSEEGIALTGMAVLLNEPEQPFVYPSEAVTTISRLLADRGDVSVLNTAA
ncbi:MAG: protein kinase [Deltaproteobacteria bacterium]|nr:protein kinase [Deltaproteobacteria bacterium]